MKQLFYEDVQVGGELPSLAKVATTRMLVEWAGATGNFDPLHYDDKFAAGRGVGRAILHGALKRAWMTQMVSDWIGEGGFIKKLSAYYIRVDYPRYMKTMTEPEAGETWLCKGKVSKKYVKDGENLVECEIWVENGKGEKTTPGSATVALPARAA